jgi:hypothetical protein
MKISFEYDTEKDAAELNKLQALVNTLQPTNTQIKNKRTELESLLTTTQPTKVVSIKENSKVSWTWGEQEIGGVRVIIHYPKDTNDWMSLNNPHNNKKGYRVKDPKGTIHIIPNASSFARNNNLDAIKFGNLAGGRRKELNGWTCVEHSYQHIQPYLKLEQITS